MEGCPNKKGEQTVIVLSSHPFVHQEVTYLPIPDYAVPNDGIHWESGPLCFCPHPWCFGSHFDVIFLYPIIFPCMQTQDQAIQEITIGT